MNVLILTPDSVGSTLLQRVLTIYMQFHGFDKPVINIHDLTNGIIKYHNDHFNQVVLGKPSNKTDWGHHQSLEEVTNLLRGTDHYTVTRLAQYRIKNRQDSMSDQQNFYQYLNDNFFIISGRRENVLEQVISWELRKRAKKVNVFSHEEKINSLLPLYKDPFVIDQVSLVAHLESYKNYLHWCDNHFEISSFFIYEKHAHNINDFILNLPIFGSRDKLSWGENFGQSFDDWNRYHYLNSDIGSLSDTQLLSATTTNILECRQSSYSALSAYKDISDDSWPTVESIEDFKNVPEAIVNECLGMHNLDISQYTTKSFSNLALYNKNYHETNKFIQTMIDNGIMRNPPPIKKHTLLEKIYLIKNFQECLNTYNVWASNNSDVCQPTTVDSLRTQVNKEMAYWKPNESFSPTNNLLT